MTDIYKLNIKIENETGLEFYKNHQHYHQGDSGFDLYVLEDIKILPGETKMIDLGIKTQLNQITINQEGNIIKEQDSSYYLYARSSIYKTPLMLVNSVGIIDAGYRGTLKAVVKYMLDTNFIKNMLSESNYDIESNAYTIQKGTRLFQLCTPNLTPIQNYKLTDQLSNTSREEGGFGSTGV